MSSCVVCGVWYWWSSLSDSDLSPLTLYTQEPSKRCSVRARHSDAFLVSCSLILLGHGSLCIPPKFYSHWATRLVHRACCNDNVWQREGKRYELEKCLYKKMLSCIIPWRGIGTKVALIDRVERCEIAHISQIHRHKIQVFHGQTVFFQPY